ncbi:MAG: hypothetical protein JW838_09655 [Spirochaetes bacterium]|nr:hypothetical protein [Spirochaetota bacterium]
MRRIGSYMVDLYFRYPFFRRVPRLVLFLLVFAIGAALVFQNRRVLTNPVGWEKSLQVSTFNVVARDVSAASRGDIIAVAFEGRAGGAQGIYCSLSLDGGERLGPPVRVAVVRSRTAMHPFPAISPSGDLIVAWHAYVEAESSTRIFSSMSGDLGATWSQPKKIDLGKEMEMLPRIYYDDRGQAHLFYHGTVGDTVNLFHAVSRGGLEFEEARSLIRLSSSMRGAFFPSMTMAGRNFYIVWQGKDEDFTDDIYLIRSSNYGRTWSGKRRITSSKGNNASPSVVIQGDTLYVAYQNNDDKSWAIRMLRGRDRGGSWDDRPLAVSTGLTNCYSPVIGLSGADLMILWYDTSEGGARIYARKYSPVENAFRQEAAVSEARYESRNPVVASAGRRLLVFWEERNVIMGKQTDVYVEPPAVFSETNPEGIWSRLPYVVMRWRPPGDESGIFGYAAIVNDIPDFNPTVVNLGPNLTTEKITDNLKDGISYFHIRAVDGAQNYSRTIHYRLQLAVNPLPAPVVVSSTTPRGKPTEVRTAEFTWGIEDMERVKGFVYHLSKDSIEMPGQFTTDMSMRFDDLEEGTYFFTVAAVDKTNQFSRVSTYDFMIGPPDGVIDPDYYRRIAEEESRFLKRGRPAPVPVPDGSELARAPSVAIRFPFDPREIVDRRSFRALIVPHNIGPGSILGYSVYVDGTERPVPRRVTHRGPVLDVAGLRDGEYYIGVRCKYAVTADGRTTHYWTPPRIERITVRGDLGPSPFIRYARGVVDRLPPRVARIAILCIGLGIVMTTFGFGSRISFHVHRARFRLGLFWRLGRKKMSG